MRLIIAGSRCFAEDKAQEIIRWTLNELGWKPTSLVCGMARGVDMAAYNLFIGKIPIDEHPAEWRVYGRSAGPKRNRKMSKVADALLAIWDGYSPGTFDMIEVANKEGLTVFVVDVSQRLTTLSELSKLTGKTYE